MVFDFDHFSRESHLSQSSQSLCSHSEPTSFLTQRNVRRLERCSSHHGRCSRRGAASYGGSSRGSPSAVDVEIEVLSAGR